MDTYVYVPGRHECKHRDFGWCCQKSNFLTSVLLIAPKQNNFNSDISDQLVTINSVFNHLEPADLMMPGNPATSVTCILKSTCVLPGKSKWIWPLETFSEFILDERCFWWFFHRTCRRRNGSRYAFVIIILCRLLNLNNRY